MLTRIMHLTIALSLLIGSVAFAQATPAGWYTCNVIQVGTTDASSGYAYLTDTAATPAFTNKAFKFNKVDMLNAQLATLLTAVSAGKQVYTYLSGAALAYVYVKN